MGGKQGNKWFPAMWIIHIIEGVRFNGGHLLLVLGDFFA